MAGVSRQRVLSVIVGERCRFLPWLKRLTVSQPKNIGEVQMASRDYESQPETEALGIDNVIRGLCGDLEALRKGEISTQDAMARSALAKQIFNGFRIYLNGSKLLADTARPVSSAKEIEGKAE